MQFIIGAIDVETFVNMSKSKETSVATIAARYGDDAASFTSHIDKIRALSDMPARLMALTKVVSASDAHDQIRISDIAALYHMYTTATAINGPRERPLLILKTLEALIAATNLLFTTGYSALNNVLITILGPTGADNDLKQLCASPLQFYIDHPDIHRTVLSIELSKWEEWQSQLMVWSTFIDAPSVMTVMLPCLA